jgi:5-methylcytosine-specific restriction protein A
MRPRTYRPAGYRSHDERRGTAAARGYDAAWRRFRRSFLAEHPLCADCGEQGIVAAASELHHVERVRDNPARRLDPGNVIPLCHGCHSRRTARGE